MSPTQQVNKSQRGAALLPVEPDTEIVQGGLGGQPGLKAIQLVRPLPVQPEGVVELLKDRFHDLAYPSQPAAQSLGPRGLAVAFGRRDQPGAVAVLPPLMPLPSLEALIRHIPAQGRRPQGGQPGVGSMPKGEEILGQCLVLGAGRGKAEAGNDALRIYGKEQVKAFIPAQAVAPANISLSGQPPELAEGPAPAFRVPYGTPGTVQRLIEAVPSLQQAGQTAEESRQGSVATPGQPVELVAPRQGGESWPQAAGRVTVEVPFAAEGCPLAEDDQGDYLALSQGSLGTGNATGREIGICKNHRP